SHFIFTLPRPPPSSILFPYTTLFRSMEVDGAFYALLFRLLGINGVNAQNQTTHLQTFSLPRFLGVFFLRHSDGRIGIEADRHHWRPCHWNFRLFWCGGRRLFLLTENGCSLGLNWRRSQ